MKKLILLTICAGFFLQGIAQKRCAYPACKVDFAKNKLYIVQTGIPAFDSALKAAISLEWTVSPVGGYISKKEFEVKKRLDGYSFLEPAVTHWYIPKSPSQREEHSVCAISFLEGHTVYPSTYINYESIDLLEANATDIFSSSIYRLDLIIRGRNNYYASGLPKNEDDKKNKLAVLQQKILLVNDNAIHNTDIQQNLFSADAFNSYAHKIEIAAEEKVKRIIQSRNSDYVLAVRLATDLGTGIFFYDVQTGSLIGKFDTKDWKGPVRSTDVELLQKAINE